MHPQKKACRCTRIQFLLTPAVISTFADGGITLFVAGRRRKGAVYDFWLDSSARGFGERVTALNRGMEIGELHGRTVVIPQWVQTVLRLFDRSLSLPLTHTRMNTFRERARAGGRRIRTSLFWGEEGGREGRTDVGRERKRLSLLTSHTHAHTHTRVSARSSLRPSLLTSRVQVPPGIISNIRISNEQPRAPSAPGS